MNTLEGQAYLDEDKALLQEAKAVVLGVIPGAHVILFGSRARGKVDPESDYDLLVIAPEALSLEKQEALNSALYSLELEHKVVLSTLVWTLARWNDINFRAAPLRQIIDREGVNL